MNKLIVSTACVLLMTSMTIAADTRSGEELFLKYCKACHGTDGKAQTTMGKKLKIRELIKTMMRTKKKNLPKRKNDNEVYDRTNRT